MSWHTLFQVVYDLDLGMFPPGTIKCLHRTAYAEEDEQLSLHGTRGALLCGDDYVYP